ncbi:MAG: beta-N-acetylglucosaminidase domain-containing protein [Bacteroidaceae bacterium]|nr:beta-N-acetylglucosaminidase domain-containing protein [Bacteroidaceae bacterium]MBQ9170080.1 beta-N-acetylglucosaminidase domain-containing protein [Bacteroidaceae bacterium]
MRRHLFLLLLTAVCLCSFAERRELTGTFGDKAVKAYRKKIPVQAEGFYLKVTPSEIVVAGRDESGLFYGKQVAEEIQNSKFIIQEGRFKEVLPLNGDGTSFEIRDWPSVSCRGVIEGFYGNPWSHEDRLRQFDFYGKHRLNIYVYGPKDDPYHRAHWRDPYPEAEAARLKELAQAAHRNHVQFVWAIHPGGDIRWNKADSLAVVNKLNLMYGLGIRTFAVFFDDIGGEGAKAEKQAGLMNYLTDAFVRKHKDVQPLIICPTQYNKAWSSGDYLSILGTTMYPEVRIMWTGNTVVDMIERDDMEWTNAQIRRKAFIWLNYPVNDYCQSRLLMGKTYGNGLDIADLVSGFCSNPMEYAEASKVSLYSIADYCWNMPSYDAEQSWERAVAELMPTSHEAFRFFCKNNIDLGKTGHGLRREGESPDFGKVPNETYFSRLVTEADALLADSLSQPEMLREIAPWVETMRVLGQRGLQVLSMQKALALQDSLAFVAHYRALQKLEEKQKTIVSRDFEGSVVKAKPVVSGTVVTPWVNEEAARLVKEYKKCHAYGREFFPQQVVEDGLYYIMYKGKYLTDVNAAADRTGDFPLFVAEPDTINPQRQLWNIELIPATGRYKITNAQDGRYVNEQGTFWRNKAQNPFEAEWHTFVIVKTPEGYTIQCGGRAGSNYWKADADRIKNDREGTAFQIRAP